MSYLLRLFSAVEAIFIVLLGFIFYIALQSGDLIVIILSFTLLSVLVVYSALRRETSVFSS
jgi:hypothetical protein